LDHYNPELYSCNKF